MLGLNAWPDRSRDRTGNMGTPTAKRIPGDRSIRRRSASFCRLLLGLAAGCFPPLSARPDPPNDPLWEFQWNLRAIGAPEAWKTTRGSGEVVVVVIDTGVDYTHEDLAPNMWMNPGESGRDAEGRDKSTNGIDDDGNGYVDDVHGIDVVSGDSDPMDEGFIAAGVPVPAYHGTSCAGVIGAIGDNGLGVAGLNWSVSILAIRALWYDVDREFDQRLYEAHLVEAFRYVLKMKRAGVNIRATSNSYGIAAHSKALRDAIDAVGHEGILNVFSAGNNNLDNDDLTFLPASYDSPSILSVAGTTEGDQLWALSNFGRSTVHIAAPGLEVATTRRVNRYTISFSGTSAAAPHVAGAIALLASAVPTASASQIRSALLGSADPATALAGRVRCNGRLNLPRALARLSSGNVPPIVLHVKPAGARTRSETIDVTFSQSMNPASVESAFRLSPAESGQFAWSEDFQRLTFVPNAPMTRTDHLIEILGTAESAQGMRLDGNYDGANNDPAADTFTSSFGLPVANDNFAEAQGLSGFSGSVDGTTRRASPETEEPDHAKNPWSATSVWFEWVAPADGSYVFEIAQATFDTLLAVYQGETLNTLAEVASGTAAGQSRSRASFVAQSEIRYHIAVAGKSRSRDKYFLDPSSFGEFRLAWRPATVPMTLNGFTPRLGPPGTEVVIRGENLDQATNLWIGGGNATFWSSGSDRTYLVAIIPPDADDGPLRLSGVTGEVISAETFSVLPPALRILGEPPASITLRWGATSTSIVLESAPAPQDAPWIAVSNGLVRTARQSSVQLEPSGIGCYYRLKKLLQPAPLSR